MWVRVVTKVVTVFVVLNGGDSGWFQGSTAPSVAVIAAFPIPSTQTGHNPDTGELSDGSSHVIFTDFTT